MARVQHTAVQMARHTPLLALPPAREAGRRRETPSLATTAPVEPVLRKPRVRVTVFIAHALHLLPIPPWKQQWRSLGVERAVEGIGASVQVAVVAGLGAEAEARAEANRTM